MRLRWLMPVGAERTMEDLYGMINRPFGLGGYASTAFNELCGLLAWY